jgi:prepilin-type N-terminal cleavage/methylation domain-containing protein
MNTTSGTPGVYRAQRGFSLTEVLVAVAIFAIIFIAALLIYDRSNQVFRAGMEASDVQQTTRVAFDTLISDLRMTGFDFDRDGDPLTSEGGVTQYQQPDEQFEYIGRSAITIRANFDYESRAADGNGREPDLESPQFPVVTTGNHEIVTYVLRSADSSKNVDKIEFFADVSVPRSAYPGGSAETQVTIPDVDLSNENPPYTLYRVILDKDDATPIFQPLANNIRSLTFTYFEDTTGQVPLTNIAGTTALAQDDIDTLVGGAGQYDPENANATLPGRILRSKVRSLRVDLIGMNERPDRNYTDPYEELPAVQNYRKYNLASVIAPRNLGRRGVREQSTRPPGPPTVTDVCFGLSGMARLTWTPHGETPIHGAAEQFEMLADTVGAGVWPLSQSAFSATTAWMSGLDPATLYYYAVRAINGYGSEVSTSPYMSGMPWNNTTLESPANLSASGPVEPEPVAGGIQLDWSAPPGFVTGKNTLNCVSGSVVPAPFQLGEIAGYRVWRGREDDFSTDPSNQIFNETSTQVVKDNASATASAFDAVAAPCKSYYYRVMAVKHFPGAPTGPNGSPVSAIYPPEGEPGIEGSALSTGFPPKAPINLEVDNTASDESVDPYIVKLDWPRVVQDTDNNRIGVDDYVITRYRRLKGGTEYQVDPNFTAAYPSPQVTDGLDQGAEISFTDESAPQFDAETEQLWEYEYTVRAKTCEDEGAESIPAQYPPPCEFEGSSIIESGAASGDGSAINPWVMDSGDTIFVLPPPGVEITRVVFRVYDAGGTSIETAVVEDGTGGFFYVWKDLIDDEIYRVLITITNADGCVEQQDRYVLDQMISPCTVAPASVVEGPEISGTGQTKFKDFTITVDNTGDENLNLQSVTFTWADADSANAKLVRITYPGGVDTAFSQTTPGTITEFVPAGTLSVTPADTTYDIVVRFEYQGKIGPADKTFTNAISSFCVAYAISSEPGTTKHCNLVGTTTNNPDACN